MEAALHVLQKGNNGIRVTQETKIIEGIHIHYSTGYKVWETKAETRR